TSGSTGIKMRALALGMWLYGFRHLKVKVGIEGHDDAARLRIIRKRAGAKMDIRIDANEAWPANKAAQKMLELKPFDISAVEQPAAGADMRKQGGMAVMRAESLCGLVAAERATAGNWCDVFNIRLSKCGGFIPSLRLAQFAAHHGLGYQLGCQIGETAVLSAAGRAFPAPGEGPRAGGGPRRKHSGGGVGGGRRMGGGYGG